jgi:DedD protein
VQTGAFVDRDRADNVKAALASRGITSIVDMGGMNDTIYYRVRVGPYTSENEAKYWLSLVKAVDGFEQSQIRVSQVKLD